MGRTNVAQIIQGYGQGLFLMAEDEDDDLHWYSTPRGRTLIPLDDRFRYPRSLNKVLNKEIFSVRINQAFASVVEGCADRQETWINESLKQIYWDLHQAGWAHSFETWQGDQLAGGLLGIAIGGAFIGESMFYRIPNGSKVAMVKLVEHLRQRKFQILDAQLPNPHLDRFGAIKIPQEDYVELLEQAIGLPCRFD